MKNIKKGLIAVVFMLSILVSNAQEQSRKEKMEALKIAYITEKLDLTTEESKTFWPVMNDYQNAKKALNTRKKSDKKPNIDEMSDTEINTFIESKLQKAQNLLDLRKEYTVKFKKVLPIKKVAKLIEAERNFRREVLKRMKKNNK